MQIIHTSQIKPLGTRHFRVVVINRATGDFVIENARTGQRSAPYTTGSCGGVGGKLAYETLLEAYQHSPKVFNKLCTMEMN